MVVASRAKASDRAALLKKLLPILKKRYKIQIPKGGKPVLETMLYAVCLEDSTVEEADESFKRLFTDFPDLNEVRVSTVGEIERAFAGQASAEWRAFRVISVLKFVFDKNYAFEFESLRKKTLDLATKQLAKIKDLSPFVRDYTLHEVTGAHMIPIDQGTARLLVWLGLALPNQTQEQNWRSHEGARFARPTSNRSYIPCDAWPRTQSCRPHLTRRNMLRPRVDTIRIRLLTALPICSKMDWKSRRQRRRRLAQQKRW